MLAICNSVSTPIRTTRRTAGKRRTGKTTRPVLRYSASQTSAVRSPAVGMWLLLGAAALRPEVVQPGGEGGQVADVVPEDANPLGPHICGEHRQTARDPWAV